MLSPRDPEMMHFCVGIGTANYVKGNQEEAVVWTQRVIQARSEAPSGHRLQVAALELLSKVVF